VSASASALSGGSTAHTELIAEAEGPSNESLGIILFIVSEAVMFGAFFAQYFYNRILADTWPTRAGLPTGFEKVPSFPLPLIMTVLLVASGFTAHWAQTAIRRDDRDQFQGWLIVTILLGVAFLGVQAYEYATFIFVEHFNITSGIYGTVFFSLTGLHGIHVTIGALLLIGVLIRAFLGHFSSRNHFGVEGTILYWHFVDVVWIALYATLYLL
jgi:cytochrome c oxidase subunit 3